MNRKGIFVALLLVVIVGGIGGWFAWQMLSGDVLASPVQSDSTHTPVKLASRSGYCCVNAGSACEAVTDPGICFRGSGIAYNATKQNCDYFCIHINP